MNSYHVEKGQLVLSAGGLSTGRTTGSSHKCQKSGCTGHRITVRWDDRLLGPQITHPCSKGMSYRKGHWEVL